MPNSVFTPIHRALGLLASPIDSALIDQAVASSVEEAVDLDWKKGLPHASDPKWQTEFAKDVAAMANSRGGIIVYGVEENSTTSAAAARHEVDISAGAQQRLLQTAHAYVRPLVTGIVFDTIESATTPGTGTLVMRIPMSTDSPHQVGTDGNPGIAFPYRNGPHTQFLREFEIARAYRQRAALATEIRDRIAANLARTELVLAERSRTWAVFIATPMQTGFTSPVAATRAEAEDLITRAADRSETLYPSGSLQRHTFLNDARYAAGAKLARRHQKWVVDTGTREEFPFHCRLEIHDNGTVLVAVDQGQGEVRTDSNSPASFRHMPVNRIESLLVDGAALVAAVAEQRALDGSWLTQFDLVHPQTRDALVVTDFERFGSRPDPAHLEIRRGSSPVETAFEQIDLEIVLPAADSDLLASSQTMATDVLNQFGVSKGVLLTQK